MSRSLTPSPTQAVAGSAAASVGSGPSAKRAPTRGATAGAGAPAQKTPRRDAELGVVVAAVALVALLVVPLPAAVLDLLLALSIASSLMVMLIVLTVERPLDFSSFPVVLLLLTLFRLALNVSSTRLVLTTGQAGKVIESFGQFVIGGNYVVGFVVFAILVGINFIVITKGAGRVAEVAARFTLDAMPGRQMSIDGDLSAGLIDDAEARRRRDEVAREADFYGAMDGSAKFVRGDAIAGLLITAVNIVGGLVVGVVQRGLPFDRALSTYAILTVGDGLVTQIPALIVSTAAGIMVTSASSGGRITSALVKQVGGEPKPMWVASGFLGALALVPGMPTIPFLTLSGSAAWAAHSSGRRKDARRAADEVSQAERDAASAAPKEKTTVQDLLQIDTVEMEIGYGLLALVDTKQGGDLLERIRMLRRQAAQDLGILIPPLRIRDNVRLPANEYVIRVRGTEVGRAELRPHAVLALDTGPEAASIPGEATKDPSFGMPARWIAPEHRLDAEALGHAVVEPATVLATHLMETLKRHAADLLGRQDVQEMVNALKESYPALVDEVVPGKVPLGTLHRVLQRLLRERVPIRDLVTVLETLADVADTTKDPEALTEHVRRALSNVIGETYVGPDGTIRGILVGPRLEAALLGLFSPRGPRSGEVLEADALTGLLGRLDELVRRHAEDGRSLPVVTTPALRVGVRRLIEPVLPDVPVVSLAELPAHANLRGVATWEMRNAA